MNFQASDKVEAYLVSEHARIGTLPRHFGRHMMTVEGRVYDLMHQYARSYSGGLWRFYELSNHGFYMSPPEDTYDICIPSNGFAGQMKADAAGITICLFAFSLLSFEYTNEVFAKHYHWLRDFAIDHADAGPIFEAID